MLTGAIPTRFSGETWVRVAVCFQKFPLSPPTLSRDRRHRSHVQHFCQQLNNFVFHLYPATSNTSWPDKVICLLLSSGCTYICRYNVVFDFELYTISVEFFFQKLKPSFNNMECPVCLLSPAHRLSIWFRSIDHLLSFQEMFRIEKGHHFTCWMLNSSLRSVVGMREPNAVLATQKRKPTCSYCISPVSFPNETQLPLYFSYIYSKIFCNYFSIQTNLYIITYMNWIEIKSNKLISIIQPLVSDWS